MIIKCEGVRTTCSNCSKCTTVASLRLGVFDIKLCSDCLKELGEMARFKVEYVDGAPLPEPISSLCQDISFQNIKNQQLQAENNLLRSVLKDAYMEANSEFTEVSKSTAEKLIGPITY